MPSHQPITLLNQWNRQNFSEYTFSQHVWEIFRDVIYFNQLLFSWNLRKGKREGSGEVVQH